MFDEILCKAELNSGYVVELTRRLVRVPSVNPPGDESEVALIVGEELEKIGFKVSYIEPSPKRVNVIAELKGDGSGKSLLFNGHLDVVPPGDLENWSFDPFGGVVRNGRIYGRGTCDMKGAIAAFIGAIKSLVDAGVNLKGDILVHAVADEEAGGKLGTKYLVERGYVKADGAIVGEGSVFSGVICLRPAVRGLCWIELETRGRASHASKPWSGVNAVLHMAMILLELKDFKLKCPPHKYLPPPTISPGTIIRGGVKTNVIPDRCIAHLDVRINPGLNAQLVLDQLNGLIDMLREREPSLSVSLKILNYAPPAEIPEDSELIECARWAVKRAVGEELKLRAGYGSNDSQYLINMANVPTICGFGPGDHQLGNAHGPDENVSKEMLVTFTKIYSLFAYKFTSLINVT